jgi:hypothetical protein
MKPVVPLIYQHYILKVSGKHGLVFKTRHHSKTYLKQVATELIGKRDGDFTHYEIHHSDHPNSEMTEPEHLLHIDASELPFFD